jgi:MGT family glycosyltransferase
MSRFLFVVPPFTGHINPTAAVGAELAARGHEVAWAGHPSIAASLLPAGATLFPTDGVLSAEDLHAIAARSQGLRGAEAFRFLWKDVILPLGEAMLPEVAMAVEYLSPDVLIVDQQAIAGAVIARQRGLPWATSATTSSELVDSFALFAMFGEWLREELHAFQDRAKVAPEVAAKGDLRFSEHLVLAFSTRELVGDSSFPPHWLFIGPALQRRPSGGEFPWEWLDPQRRHVLVTLGTVNAASGRHFFEAALAAAAHLEDRLQMIVVAPDGMLQRATPNVLILPHVPQLLLLPQIDIVICHAGHNTVCETLAHGIPLAVAPIRDDQPIIAQQVVDAGAGIRLKYGRVKPGEIVNALALLLEAPQYRAAAQRIQAAFQASGGSSAAADGLESLASVPVPIAARSR